MDAMGLQERNDLCNRILDAYCEAECGYVTKGQFRDKCRSYPDGGCPAKKLFGLALHKVFYSVDVKNV